MALRAVRDCIIVRIFYDEKSKGGIVIPDTAKQYHGSFVGVVVAIGPDYPYDLKVEDKVYYRRHEGYKIRYKESDYMSLQSKWVVGKQKEVA